MKISENCYVLHGLFTISPWVVNAGFIVGREKTLIIDAGSNYMTAQTIHGYASCANPGNNLLVVNTEPHFDHIGGNCFFKGQNIPVYSHKDINRTEEEFESLKPAYRDTITSQSRREMNEEKLLFLDTFVVESDYKISEKETAMELGDQEVKIFLTPGHSPQNISVYCSKDSVLYSGDTIVEGYIPNMEDSTPDGWEDWIESLTLIEKLNPEIVVPGHGRVIKGNDVVKQIKVMREYLEEGLKSGKAPTA